MEGGLEEARELIIVITHPSRPLREGSLQAPMRFMLTPREVQRHEKQFIYPHMFQNPFLQVGACRAWHQLTWNHVLYGFQGNRVGRQIRPCLSEAAVQSRGAHMLSQELCSAGAGRGKLTPGNGEKLTLVHTHSLNFLSEAPLLASLSGLGRKEQESSRFVHLGIFNFRGSLCEGSRRVMIGQSPPQENVPVQCSEETKRGELGGVFVLLLVLGALPWKLELWIKVPPPPLDFQVSKRGRVAASSQSRGGAQ